MALLRKKSLWRSVVESKIATLFLVVLCVLVAFAVYGRFLVEREMATRLEESAAELRALESKRDALDRKVDRLSSDQGMEAEIRKNFDVAREGETVIILVDEKEQADSRVGATTTPTQEEEGAFWRGLIPW